MLSSEVEILFRSKEALLNSWLSEVEERWKDVPEFQVGPEKLRHLAVICDGNRRTAEERD